MNNLLLEDNEARASENSSTPIPNASEIIHKANSIKKDYYDAIRASENPSVVQAPPAPTDTPPSPPPAPTDTPPSPPPAPTDTPPSPPPAPTQEM